jgi:hypothetical protein
MKSNVSKERLDPLTPDEMSVFYKSFLDKYWKVHMWYNFEWYKRNVHLLQLALQVKMDRVWRRIFSQL